MSRHGNSIPKPRRSLAEVYPETAKWFHSEKNELTACDYKPRAKSKVWWKCPTCEHEWQANIYNRVKQSNCPACIGKSVHSNGSNSIVATHPKLAEEFHPTKNGSFTPENLIAGTNRRLWWRCSTCEHEWQTTGDARLRNGCGACAGQRVHSDGRNSLQSLFPSIAEEFHPHKNHPLLPTKLRPGSSKKIWWKCNTCEHEWRTAVSNRKNGRGCSACSHHQVHSDGRTSMARTHPKLAEEFHPTKNHPFTTETLLAGSSRKVCWICVTCSHEWMSTCNNRKYGNQCPACAGQRVHSDGRNSMARTHPKLAEEFHPTKNHPFTPETLIAGTNNLLQWICRECQHEWVTTGNGRAGSKGRNGTNCPACYGRVVSLDGDNSLAALYPELIEELHPTKNGEISPYKITAHSHTQLWWLCDECGGEWLSRATPRINIGAGCPSCAKYGIDISAPTNFYVLRIENHAGIWWWKGGISVDPERRAGQIKSSLKSAGMLLDVVVHETIEYDTGKEALELEIALLHQEDIRTSTKEVFSGCSELYSCNPLQWARESGLIVERKMKNA